MFGVLQSAIAMANYRHVQLALAFCNYKHTKPRVFYNAQASRVSCCVERQAARILNITNQPHLAVLVFVLVWVLCFIAIYVRNCDCHVATQTQRKKDARCVALQTQRKKSARCVYDVAFGGEARD
jgi:hypothetical protein